MSNNVEVNDVLRWQYHYKVMGVDCVSNLTYRCGGNTAGVKLFEFHDAFDSFLPVEIAQVLSEEVQPYRTRLYNLTNGVGLSENTGDFTEGVRTGDCLPAFTAYSFVTGRNGRGEVKGSVRLSGVAEPDWDETKPVPSMGALLNYLAGVLGDSIAVPAAGNCYPVTYSTVYLAQPRVPPVSWDRTGMWAFRGITTQRSRLK